MLKSEFGIELVTLAARLLCIMPILPATALGESLPGSYIDVSGQTTYSIFGNNLRLEIDRIDNFSPNVRSGSLRIEFWETAEPYSGGAINGYRTSIRTADISGLDDTLGSNRSYLNIDANLDYSRPPNGYVFRTLIISEYSDTCPQSDNFCIVAWKSFDKIYRDFQSFISIDGNGSIRQVNGLTRIGIDRITNRSNTYGSGSLRIELWATSDAYRGGDLSGYKFFTRRTFSIGQLTDTLDNNSSFENISVSETLSAPPINFDNFVLVLSEFSLSCESVDQFCLIDYRNIYYDTPSPPSSISASDGSQSASVRINWEPSDNTDSYELYRCSDELTIVDCSFFREYDSLATSALDFQAGTFDRFFYRVKACNFAGCSEFSEPDYGFISANAISSHQLPTFENQILTIPLAYVDSPDGDAFYELEFEMRTTDLGTIEFWLIYANEISDPRVSPIPYFDASSGVLEIPELKIGELSYRVSLNIHRSIALVIFRLSTHEQINP